MSTRPSLGRYATLDFHIPRKPSRIGTGSTGPPPYVPESHNPPTVQKWNCSSQKKRIPWVAVVSLVVALACIAGCVAVLKTSDQKSIESWPTTGAPVQPSVMLSIGAAIANMSIRFMFCEGLNVTWWRKALRGTTVGELHRTWAYGTNFWEILVAGRHFNFIALASLFVSIVAVDGPLLQKASKVTTQSWSETSTVAVNMGTNTSMLDHPTGYSTGRSTAIGLLSSEFLPVVQQYNTRQAITLNYTGCVGSCNTQIVGPGLDIQCNKTMLPLTLDFNPGNYTDVLGFSFDFIGVTDPDVIRLNTTLRTTENPDNLTVHECSLHLAQVTYPVQLTNDTVILLPKSSPTANETISLQYLWPESTGMGQQRSTLGGLALIAQRKYGSTGSLYANGAPFELDTTGEAAVEYLDPVSNSSSYTWLDPTEDMLNAVRELMFRYAIVISNATQTQSVQANTVYQRTIYVSDYHYLYYAIIFMILAILTTGINIFGWWELGYALTLAPFEIAKAFNAPYLDDVPFLTTNEKAFKKINGRPIQYGELNYKDRQDEGRKTSIGEAESGESVMEMLDYRAVVDIESEKGKLGMGIPI